MDIEFIAKKIVHCAIKVHKTLGPGLLESVYQKCLTYELEKEGLNIKCEVPVPVRYGDVLIDTGFRSDMIVEDSVIIENKTVDKILPIHEAQLLTYLKITDIRLGFILNWNVTLMKNGIKRMVRNFEEPN
jgi:GxxExxY protein